MAYPDLEDVINAAVAQLQSNVAGNLAIVDARKTEPLNPKPPVQWVFGDKVNLPQMPCVLVTGHDTTENEDHFEWRKQTYQLMVEVYYQDSDVERLSRILRRYGAAIDDTLRQDQTLGLSQVRNITGIKQQYWDTMSSKTGLFQVVRVIFNVRVYTD
ncbi:hypothetical protein [Alicyclobacillus sp. ALC3]|uniref:hypothetical protein n=1 Tax=Alicyclobacillus sp. ALC3 TaxID=2796143 RepID=UPI002379F502|nr:hypothetical protein [Alicyclobacillus sp. ALC3]WDL96407.1 hypothetical protein JC200_19090 [Alicyclobacillus sp. ALC3]